jgi:hypothetical protein
LIMKLAADLISVAAANFMINRVGVGLAGKGRSMLRRSKRDRELDPAIKDLADADTLAFGGVGIASTLLPVTEAYQRVEQALAERPDDVRRQLEWLLDHGSPAGRAYAATLLGRIDPEAARAAWTSMRTDERELTTFSGCVMGRTTLGEYAGEQLARG